MQSSVLPDKVVEIRNLEIQDMHNWVMCPISYSIFQHPVIAADGHVYEHDYIFRWFEECAKKRTGRISPLTKAALYTNDLIPCHVMRQMVGTYLALYPEKKELQYKSEFNMNIWLHYLFHTETVKELYIRNVEKISTKDMSFKEFKKYAENNSRDGPYLSTNLWKTFFGKIQDFHEDFKLDELTRHLFFEEEEEDAGAGVADIVANIVADDEDMIPRPPLSLSDLDVDVDVIQSITNLQMRLNQTQIDVPEWEEEEEGEVIENREETNPENTLSIATDIFGEDEPLGEDIPIANTANTAADNDTSITEVMEQADGLGAIDDLESESGSSSGSSSSSSSSESESEDEEEEEEEPEEELEEDGEEEEEELEMNSEDELKVKLKKNTKIKKEQNNLLTCLCWFAHLKTLEVFLNIMPAITCPKIAEKYKYLFEDMFDTRNMKQTMRISDIAEIERFERVIYLMMEKGIPYNHWTRDGKMPTLLMIYLSIAQNHYPFKCLNMNLVQKPEFFVFPLGASSGSMTPKKALKLILSKTVSLYVSAHVLEQYTKYYKIEIEDILDLCVRYSSHNIWVAGEWNTEPVIERLMFNVVVSRGSIPMELVLLNSFSSRILNHCFVEGYNIENSEDTYAFPKHRDILPPLMHEDILFPKINNSEDETQRPQTQMKKKWKNTESISLKRVEYSKENGTEWAWNATEPKSEIQQLFQPSPVMSVLGWLIFMYEPPIVFKFLENNRHLKWNMKSQEFTGLDTLNPIHLAVKYYNESESVQELLEELMRHGATMEQKTSHGWYPIHYACRYSPYLIHWIIAHSENKETCSNMPLYFYPSCNTLKLSKQKLEWYQTWLPLNIFILNHCNTYNDTMIKIMNHIITHGGKRTMEELRETTGKDNSVFEYNGPVGFNIGTSVINTVHSKEETKNIKKRKHRHV